MSPESGSVGLDLCQWDLGAFLKVEEIQAMTSKETIRLTRMLQ
jgi:hypothetical protein